MSVTMSCHETKLIQWKTSLSTILWCTPSGPKTLFWRLQGRSSRPKSTSLGCLLQGTIIGHQHGHFDVLSWGCLHRLLQVTSSAVAVQPCRTFPASPNLCCKVLLSSAIRDMISSHGCRQDNKGIFNLFCDTNNSCLILALQWEALPSKLKSWT